MIAPTPSPLVVPVIEKDLLDAGVGDGGSGGTTKIEHDDDTDVIQSKQ